MVQYTLTKNSFFSEFGQKLVEVVMYATHGKELDILGSIDGVCFKDDKKILYPHCMFVPLCLTDPYPIFNISVAPNKFHNTCCKFFYMTKLVLA